MLAIISLLYFTQIPPLVLRVVSNFVRGERMKSIDEIRELFARYKIKIEYPFVKTYLLEPHILSVGSSEKVIDRKQVRIYDKDRTICDCLRYMGKMNKEIFNKAIQCYVNDPKKNVPNLIQYAKELRVQKKVKDLIGVWL